MTRKMKHMYVFLIKKSYTMSEKTVHVSRKTVHRTYMWKYIFDFPAGPIRYRWHTVIQIELFSIFMSFDIYLFTLKIWAYPLNKYSQWNNSIIPCDNYSYLNRPFESAHWKRDRSDQSKTLMNYNKKDLLIDKLSRSIDEIEL